MLLAADFVVNRLSLFVNPDTLALASPEIPTYNLSFLTRTFDNTPVPTSTVNTEVPHSES